MLYNQIMKPMKQVSQLKKSIMTALLCLTMALFLEACGVPNAKNTARAAEAFLGEWQSEDGKVILDIWIDDNAGCHGIVCKMGETDMVENWAFDGSVKKDVFSYRECTYSVVTYNEEWEASEDIRYTGGTGKFIKEEGKLTWIDDQNDTSAYVFTYVGEY